MNKKLRAKNRTKHKKDDIPNLRKFFVTNRTKICNENLNFFEKRQLLSTKTTNFLLTSALIMGTVIRRSYMPLKDIEAYEA